jgi:hypothetical protein
MSTAEIRAMCTPCRELSLGSAGIEPHSGMRFQGILPPTDSTGSRERQYRCVNCQTLWLRRIDKWGMDGGFRLAP